MGMTRTEAQLYKNLCLAVVADAFDTIRLWESKIDEWLEAHLFLRDIMGNLEYWCDRAELSKQAVMESYDKRLRDSIYHRTGHGFEGTAEIYKTRVVGNEAIPGDIVVDTRTGDLGIVQCYGMCGAPLIEYCHDDDNPATMVMFKQIEDKHH